MKDKTNALPLGITEKDLVRPKYGTKDRLAYDVGESGTFTLYEVASDRRGHAWVLTTLGISRGRNGRAARTYGIRCDNGGVARVGNGPHVLRTITVYVRQSRVKALAKLIELHTQGLAQAGQVRDQLSSRRAEGALRRSRGETWWRWSS